MKTRIKKIVLLTAALILLGTGVSFAYDRFHKPPGHAYGHYKSKGHPVWYKKQPGPKWRHYREYAPIQVHKHYHYYDSYRHRGGYEGTAFELSVSDQTLAFKVVVKDRKY